MTPRLVKKRPHLVLAIVWAVLAIPTVLVWHDSILWVAFMSIYAIIVSHLAADEADKAKHAAEESK